VYVNQHAEVRLRARLTDASAKDPAGEVIGLLEALPGEPGSVAILVREYGHPIYLRDGSNGDQLVVIARGGEVHTVMLRRSWNQPFTPAALNVDKVVRLRTG
jgi:hypothetical protein